MDTGKESDDQQFIDGLMHDLIEIDKDFQTNGKYYAVLHLKLSLDENFLKRKYEIRKIDVMDDYDLLQRIEKDWIKNRDINDDLKQYDAEITKKISDLYKLFHRVQKVQIGHELIRFLASTDKYKTLIDDEIQKLKHFKKQIAITPILHQKREYINQYNDMVIRMRNYHLVEIAHNIEKCDLFLKQNHILFADPNAAIALLGERKKFHKEFVLPISSHWKLYESGGGCNSGSSTSSSSSSSRVNNINKDRNNNNNNNNTISSSNSSSRNIASLLFNQVIDDTKTTNRKESDKKELLTQTRRWKLGKTLGKGSYGVVYEAYDAKVTPSNVGSNVGIINWNYAVKHIKSDGQHKPYDNLKEVAMLKYFQDHKVDGQYVVPRYMDDWSCYHDESCTYSLSERTPMTTTTTTGHEKDDINLVDFYIVMDKWSGDAHKLSSENYTVYKSLLESYADHDTNNSRFIHDPCEPHDDVVLTATKPIDKPPNPPFSTGLVFKLDQLLRIFRISYYLGIHRMVNGDLNLTQFLYRKNGDEICLSDFGFVGLKNNTNYIPRLGWMSLESGKPKDESNEQSVKSVPTSSIAKKLSDEKTSDMNNNKKQNMLFCNPPHSEITEELDAATFHIFQMEYLCTVYYNQVFVIMPNKQVMLFAGIYDLDRSHVQNVCDYYDNVYKNECRKKIQHPMNLLKFTMDDINPYMKDLRQAMFDITVRPAIPRPVPIQPIRLPTNLICTKSRASSTESKDVSMSRKNDSKINHINETNNVTSQASSSSLSTDTGKTAITTDTTVNTTTPVVLSQMETLSILPSIIEHGNHNVTKYNYNLHKTSILNHDQKDEVFSIKDEDILRDHLENELWFRSFSIQKRQRILKHMEIKRTHEFLKCFEALLQNLSQYISSSDKWAVIMFRNNTDDIHKCESSSSSHIISSAAATTSSSSSSSSLDTKTKDKHDIEPDTTHMNKTDKDCYEDEKMYVEYAMLLVACRFFGNHYAELLKNMLILNHCNIPHHVHQTYKYFIIFTDVLDRRNLKRMYNTLFHCIHHIEINTKRASVEQSRLNLVSGARGLQNNTNNVSYNSTPELIVMPVFYDGASFHALKNLLFSKHFEQKQEWFSSNAINYSNTDGQLKTMAEKIYDSHDILDDDIGRTLQRNFPSQYDGISVVFEYQL
jgi:hypothetical protein